MCEVDDDDGGGTSEKLKFNLDRARQPEPVFRSQYRLALSPQMSAQNFQLQPSVKDQQTNRTKASGSAGMGVLGRGFESCGGYGPVENRCQGQTFQFACRQATPADKSQTTNTHTPRRTKKGEKSSVDWPTNRTNSGKKNAKIGGWGSGDTISYPVLTDVTGSWLPEKWNSAPKNGLMAQSQALGSVKGIRRHSASSMAGFSFQFRHKMRMPVIHIWAAY